MIFVSGFVTAQTEVLKKKDLSLSTPALFQHLPSLLPVQKSHIATGPMPFLSPDFYARQLGFFCRQEIKMDKITRIPFRFRLGSVEEVNRLEGKRR